ncbi:MULTISPECIES: hypothetical protein [Methanobacterium]|jgi:hypothetical protein|uniref:Uncharacterized protein n=1 Tax=Methanobacterium veterum TaxID=408577 RepID=A0A9E5DIQ7_9EURY|nr:MULTISPECIES: hypothetical protein [Methanobacterium]MCZ3364423.1 hypothetical protein [Methanobacterium veterum]MCZ3372174.1 hypothetical protein [Methanobacterium veterum]
MKLEFHGDFVTIYMPLVEREKAVTFLNKYDINYKEDEITRIDGTYIQFGFYASETIKRLFDQFFETELNKLQNW